MMLTGRIRWTQVLARRDSPGLAANSVAGQA